MSRGLMVLSLMMLLAGCSFSRVVVNGYVREMETSWIEPGRTTKEEIVARFGLPPSLIGAKGVRPGAQVALSLLRGQMDGGGAPAVGIEAEGGFRANDARTFRWSASDMSSRTFESGWLIYPTFSATVNQRGHDIFIRFDEQDVVQLLSRTTLCDGEVKVLEWREVIP